jgi:hypothetical protein
MLARMFGRPVLLALLAAAVFPASAAASTITFSGSPGEGDWVKTRAVTVQFTTEADAAECAVDAGAFTACDDSLTATGLADGNHSVSVRAGGDTATRSFKVDATAPVATLGANPAEGSTLESNRSEPMYFGGGGIVFEATDAHLATRECRMDGAPFELCAGTWVHMYGCLDNGAHTFELRLTDEAGNVTVAARHWSIRGFLRDPSCPVPPAEPEPDLSDTTSSAVSFTGGGIAAGAWSSERDVTVEFDATGAECAADAGAFAPCDGSFTATGLTDGTHSISVRAGGQAAAVRRFRVDATAPVANLSTWPAEGQVLAPSPGTAGPIHLAGGSVSFVPEEKNLATTECRWDGGAFGACDTANSHRVYCQPNGAHTFQLRLTDKAGNVTLASRSFSLNGWSRNPTCPVAPVEPDPDLSDTPSGAVSFTGGIAAAAWSNQRDVTVEFSAAGAECAVDAGAFASCDGSFTATGLSDGVHSISVRAGGQAAAVRRFRVDATAPAVTLGSFPAEGGSLDFTPSPRMPGPMILGPSLVSYLVMETHLASAQCRFGDEAFAACDGPLDYSEYFNCLPNGTHTFQARVTDRAGNVTVASRTFTLSGWTASTNDSWQCGEDGHMVLPPKGLMIPPGPLDPPLHGDPGPELPAPTATPQTTLPAPKPTAIQAARPYVALASQHTRRWTKLRRLKLVDAPKGAKVTVSCNGCGKKVRKLSDLTGRKLKPGTRVTIKVAKRTITITIRANRTPRVT